MTGLALLGHQVRLEQRSFWRNPQAAFFTFLMPLGLLAILGPLNADPVPDSPGARFVDFLVPGIVVFGLVGATYGNLAASIAVLRDEGVLKRIRVTPLPPLTYLTSHVVSALVLGALLTVLTVAGGWLAFGVEVQLHAVPGLVLAIAVGAACLCALGLALSAFIPNADAASPIVNASYLPLTIVSGVFFPLKNLPAWLDAIVGSFPVRRLAHALQGAFDPSARAPAVEVLDLMVLAAWLAAGLFVAHRYFRWHDGS